MSQISGTVRVLHVDDEPDMTALAATALEREDPRFSVETATNAREGLKRLDQDTFDCIVSDYDMPGLNGLEFLEAIRRKAPEIPFILYTSAEPSEFASNDLARNVTDYLEKSGDPEQYAVLAERIRDAVDSPKNRIRVLHEATRRLMAADTEDEVVETTTEAAKNILGFPYSVFRLLKDDRLVPVHVTTEMQETMGGQRPAYEVGEPTAGLAFAKGETIVYDDVRELDDEIDRGNVRASMYLPVGDRGVLTIADTRPDSFDQSDIELTEILVTHADAALELVEQTQELKRQNERLDEFVSIVSHDLQNPLSVAEGYLSLAREEQNPEHLEQVASALDRMNALIEDTLELARKGQFIDNPGPVVLDRVVRVAWETASPPEATLDRQDRLGTVMGDGDRIRELLENLFSNAVEQGSDEVTVGRLETGFYVADDGPGIPAEKRDDIFDYGYTSRDEGTGLGLAIVAQIAEAHGWELTVGDSEDGGARFEITGVEYTE